MLASMYSSTTHGDGNGGSSISSDYSLAAGVLMAKETSPTAQQQQQQQQLKLQKLQKRRRHSISTTVYHATTSAVMVANVSTTASLSTTCTTITTVDRTAPTNRNPASVTGVVMPMSSTKAQDSRRPSFVKASAARSAAATSPNKRGSQRRAQPISSTINNNSSRANVVPLSGNRPHDALPCSHSSFSSSSSSSSCLSASSPVQVLTKQQPVIRGTREPSQPIQQELPILRCQYIARDVKVLIGTRWKLKKFETKTVVLFANGSATPKLTICTKMAVEKDSSAVRFNLGLDLICVHSGPNGLKLKSPALRMKIRFATAADATIWFNLIQETMRHARWIKDIEETACLSRDMNATVLVARHVPTDKEFVIKVLPKVRVDDGSCTEILVLKKLFRAVAASTATGSSSMAALQHVLEYRVVETAKDVRIVMPKLPGKNLLQFLQQQHQDASTHQRHNNSRQPHHTISEADSRSALLGLCESLHALHAIGIVHCDLKLENILLTDVTNVRVIDFGGAYDLSSADGSPLMLKHRSNSSSSQQHRRRMIGTPGYIAPERILFVDEPPTPAADVFSVGIVLFQMLTGRQPFTRSSRHCALSMQDATALHWKSAEKILSSHGVSPAAMQLIERMVKSDPRSRITVEEIFCHPWLCC